MCFTIVEHWEYMLTQQHLGHYYDPCETAFFRLPPRPLRVSWSVASIAVFKDRQ
jgi:hypothetical protein